MTKHREPVLGVNDPINPDGRFTIELYDEHTGKVAHRVRQDNTILNSYKAMVNQRVRAQYNIYPPSNAPLASYFGTSQDNWWQQLPTTPSEGPMSYGMETQFRALYLSDSNLAVNSNEWAIPGNIVAHAGAVLSSVFGTTGAKNGAVGSVQMVSDRARRRYSFDFTAGQALGVVSSFGFGSVLGSSWGVSDDVVGMPSYLPVSHGASLISAYGWQSTGGSTNLFSDPGGVGTHEGLVIPSFAAAINISAQWTSDKSGVVWIAGGNFGLVQYNLNSNSLRPYQHVPNITGPSFGAIGANSADSIGIVIIGTDMWLSYGLTLKKCAIPTNTTLSVTATFATVSGFTDAAILDITTDGANIYALGSTKVFVISPSTGAVTSSWAHNLNNGTTPVLSSIEHTALPSPYLYITRNNVITALAAPSYEAHYTNGSGGRHVRTYSFTTAGAVGPYHFGHQNYSIYGAISSAQKISWTGSFSDGWGALSMVYNGALGAVPFRGPQTMSRAVLGSPVIKDASKAMRVIYDFEFS